MTDQADDDVFDDTTVIDPVEPASNDPEPEVETGDDAAEPPAATKPDDAKTVPMAALTDERRKRQDLEKKLEEYEKTDKPKRPDIFEDPEGALEDVKWTVKAELSRDLMLDSKEDYEEMEKVFIDLSKTNPTLVQQMRGSANPARFAYTTAKAYTENQKLLDPETAKQEREKMKAAIRAEVLAELEQSDPKAKRKQTALSMPNLNRATSVKGGGDDGGDNVFDDAAF